MSDGIYFFQTSCPTGFEKLFVALDMSLPKFKFDIYQGAGAKNYFKSHTNS